MSYGAALAATFALLISLPSHGRGAQWEPVTRADLAGTADLPNRDPVTLDMRTSGDFNGDRRPATG